MSMLSIANSQSEWTFSHSSSASVSSSTTSSITTTSSTENLRKNTTNHKFIQNSRLSNGGKEKLWKSLLENPHHFPDNETQFKYSFIIQKIKRKTDESMF